MTHEMIWTAAASLALIGQSASGFTQERTAPDASAAAGEPSAPEARSASDIVADALLERMTPAERRALLHGPMLQLMSPSERPVGIPIGAGYVPGVPRLGIPALVETDAGLGVANLGNARKGDVATALPSALATAASWDVTMAERGGLLVGSEAKAKGFNVLLAGGVNLVREPRSGRNFEYFGEDPLLSGIMAGNAVRGIQSNGIVSTVKHFALNAQETGRNVLSADMDEAALRESDLLAFQIAIEVGRPGAVMCGYNRVNGEFACESDFLLNQVLRTDWGYKGWVMSDWGAVHSTGAIMKGLDQQSGEQIDQKPYFGSMLDQAILDGRVPAEVVDRSAGRILRSMAANGLFSGRDGLRAPIDYGAHAREAQAISEASIVLLKNEGGLLPLGLEANRILVVGGHADVGVLSGGGSSQVRPVGGPALEIRRTDVGAASVFATQTYIPSSPLSALRQALPSATITFNDGKDVARTVSAAKAADLVIIFAEQWTTEAYDQPSLDLDAGANGLIEGVAGANPRTIVVLETGGPVLMPWLDKVPVVLEAWYPGQRGGEAIARVLTGAVNPSGRLPITFPASLAQTPNPTLPGAGIGRATQDDLATYGLQSGTRPFNITYPEGADVGYRWYDRRKLQPLFPFGHGLSYTTFRYGNLATRKGSAIVASFSVKNTGRRRGVDVAQVYMRLSGSKRLVGWQRVELAPGESKRVTVEIDIRPLARFDEKRHLWALDTGEYELEVAQSSAAPKLRSRIRLTGISYRP